MNDHEDVPESAYGKWADIAKREFMRRGFKSVRLYIPTTFVVQPVAKPETLGTPPSQEEQVQDITRALKELRAKEESLKEKRLQQQMDEEEIELLRKATKPQEEETELLADEQAAVV